MVGQFTAVYMKRGTWYVAYVEEIPGVNTQDRTLAEVRRNLNEALIMVKERAMSGKDVPLRCLTPSLVTLATPARRCLASQSSPMTSARLIYSTLR